MEEDLINVRYEDFSLICRICLKKGNDLMNIFYASFDDMKIIDILQELFADKIVENDGKPEQICHTCVLHTMQVNEFVNLYYSSKKSCEKLLECINTKTKNVIELKKSADQVKGSKKFIKLDQKNGAETPEVIEVVQVQEQEKFSVYMTDYICNFCGFDFRTDPCGKKERRSIRILKKHTLEEHLIEISGQCDSYKCLKCKVEMKLFSEVKKHFATKMHQNKECSICKSVFNTVKDCFNHTKSCKENEWKKKLNNEDYKCIHCNNMKISGFENVLQHYKSEHEDDSDCMICNKSAKRHMELHLHKHRPRRMKYLCLRCLEHFKTPTLLAEHKKNVDHTQKKCEICDMVVPSRLFGKHKMSHKNKSYMCELCGKSFRESSNLRRHYKCQHLGERFLCDQCPASYTTHIYLLDHISRKHPESKVNRTPGSPRKNRLAFVPPDAVKPKKDMYYTCDICDKKLRRTNKRFIKMHQMFHINGHTVMCLASKCQLTFADKDERLKHMMEDHPEFTCADCKKSFFNFMNFQVHCLLHDWQKDNSDLNDNLTCRICKENHNDKASLCAHVLKLHRLHLCSKENCGVIFTTKQHLQIHFDKQHVKAVFACTVCNKKFVTESALSVHQRRHSDSRKYKCDSCTFTFNTVAQLNIHYRTHTGERPFTCQFCHKTFAHNYTKTSHERLHTGEKPYCCPYCEQRFSDGSQYRRHYHQHEKQNDQKPIQETDFILHIYLFSLFILDSFLMPRTF